MQFETNSNTLTVSFTEEIDESSANDASFINRFKIYDRNFHATGFNAGNKPEPIDNAINNISINGKQITFELNENAIGSKTPSRLLYIEYVDESYKNDLNGVIQLASSGADLPQNQFSNQFV